VHTTFLAANGRLVLDKSWRIIEVLSRHRETTQPASRCFFRVTPENAGNTQPLKFLRGDAPVQLGRLAGCATWGWTLAGQRMRGGSPCAPRKRPKIGAVHLRSRYSTANRESSPDLKSFSAIRRTRSRDGELARQQNAARRSWEGREL